jgi:hypothetical protein
LPAAGLPAAGFAGLFLDEGRLSGIFEFLSKKRDGQARCVAGQWIVIKQVEPGGGVGSRERQHEYRQTAKHTLDAQTLAKLAAARLITPLFCEPQ